MIPKKRIRNRLRKNKLFSNPKAVCKRQCLHAAFFLLTSRLHIRLHCRLLRSSKTPFLALQKGADDRIPTHVGSGA